MTISKHWAVCTVCGKTVELISPSLAWHFQEYPGWCQVDVRGLHEASKDGGNILNYYKDGEFCSKKCAMEWITPLLMVKEGAGEDNKAESA